jgi:hypothetical protein
MVSQKGEKNLKPISFPQLDGQSMSLTWPADEIVIPLFHTNFQILLFFSKKITILKRSIQFINEIAHAALKKTGIKASI